MCSKSARFGSRRGKSGHIFLRASVGMLEVYSSVAVCDRILDGPDMRRSLSSLTSCFLALSPIMLRSLSARYPPSQSPPTPFSCVFPGAAVNTVTAPALPTDTTAAAVGEMIAGRDAGAVGAGAAVVAGVITGKLNDLKACRFLRGAITYRQPGRPTAKGCSIRLASGVINSTVGVVCG